MLKYKILGLISLACHMLSISGSQLLVVNLLGVNSITVLDPSRMTAKIVETLLHGNVICHSFLYSLVLYICTLLQLFINI